MSIQLYSTKVHSMKEPLKITSTLLPDSERSNLIKVLFKIAPNAVYSSDLTSDVSVLVTNPSQSPNWLQSRKFRYIVQYRPDVLVIKYESVLSQYEAWLKGDDTDNNEERLLESFDRLQVFEGLQISVGRLDSTDSLEKLRDLVETRGGIILETLSNSSDVLITTVLEGKRYSKAKEWKIPVVSPDWCFDSVDRGAVLGFEYYELLCINGKGRRKDACDWTKYKNWKRKEKQDRSVRLAKRNARGVSKDKTDESGGERNLKVAKLDHQDRLWNSIMKDTRINSLHRSQSGFTGDDEGWKAEQRVDSESKNETHVEKTMVSTQRQEENSGEPLLFEGISFLLYGFNAEEEKILRAVLAEYRADIDDGKSSQVDYVIVNSDLDKKPSELPKGQVITEFAIERCIYFHKRSSLDQSSYWGNPLFFNRDGLIREFRSCMKLDINDQKVVVAITGFKGIDLSQFEKLLKGKLSRFFDFKEIFTKECELLIVADVKGDNTLKKLKMAKKWDVKLLDLKRFWIISKDIELSEAK
ncbi:hypothetical protein FOA43_002472 [Brettanomyces nanus]|uniref:BRCT domain-containing protein n=1 Tax=Eeniella nana TaxID=13502 RepID=A0A875S5V4_EENNA|nr:uncharacterized protein FOA43_002472 [Brettanomyces nanus]QPG75129.1 hypothetical protein FOA43_002472 [Brettanomyces nanus]